MDALDNLDEAIRVGAVEHAVKPALAGGCETIMLIERKPGDAELTIRVEKQKDEEDSLAFEYRAEKVDFEHPLRGVANSLVICRRNEPVCNAAREARRHADRVSIAYQCKPGTSTTISRLIGLLGQGRTRSAGSYERIKDAVPLAPLHLEACTAKGVVLLSRNDASPPSVLCTMDG